MTQPSRTSGTLEEPFSSGHSGKIKRVTSDLLRPYDPRPGRSNAPQTYNLKVVAKSMKKLEQVAKPIAENKIQSAEPQKSSEIIRDRRVVLKLFISFEPNAPETTVIIKDQETVISAITRAYEKFYQYDSRKCVKNFKLLQDFITGISKTSLKMEYCSLDHAFNDLENLKNTANNNGHGDKKLIGLDTNAVICLKLLRFLNKNLLKKYLRDQTILASSAASNSEAQLLNLENRYKNILSVFNSPKIVAKIQSQINDGIACTTNALPKDVLAIVNKYPFLLSENLRQNFIKVSGSGFERNIINYQDFVRNIQTQQSSNQGDIQDSHTRYISAITGPSDFARIRIHRAIVYRPEALAGFDILSKLGNSGNNKNQSLTKNYSQASAGSTGTAGSQNTQYSNSQNSQSQSSAVSSTVTTPDLMATSISEAMIDPFSSQGMSQLGMESSTSKPSEKDKTQENISNGLKFLQQAHSVLVTHSDYRSKLEFQFKNEKGTGLGPTIEFYQICCQYIRLKKLNIWIDRSTDTDVYHVEKLFPKPSNQDDLTSQGTLKYFWVLGNIFGKVVLDQRLIDLPISYSFLHLVLDYAKRPRLPKNMYSVNKDKTTASTCSDSNNKSINKCIPKLAPETLALYFALLQEIDPVRHIFFNDLKNKYTSADIEALCLNFTFNDDANEIIPNGADINLTYENRLDYISAQLNYIFHSGIAKQIKFFVKGFEKCLPIINLFTLCAGSATQLKVQITGYETINWSLNELHEFIEPKLGYTKSSQTYLDLCEVLVELSNEERKQFLKFLTGCSSLPPGGLGNLQPKMTVVKKTPEQGGVAAIKGSYPSVNSCQHYLKLPQYDDKELLKKKLMEATLQVGFHFN